MLNEGFIFNGPGLTILHAIARVAHLGVGNGEQLANICFPNYLGHIVAKIGEGILNQWIPGDRISQVSSPISLTISRILTSNSVSISALLLPVDSKARMAWASHSPRSVPALICSGAA